jgi:hypothetical protein
MAARPSFALLFVFCGICGQDTSGGEPGPGGAALVVRLVRPDRQASEVLRLFEGARWGDPAAALAAWKQRTGGAAPISKPTEAVIALFNPEMATEWRAFDGAEARFEVDPTTGGLQWFATVLRDDGTLAAGLTAMRLTYPEERPLAIDGRERPVARLGRPGSPLGCQVGTAVVVASTREGLARGVRELSAGGPALRRPGNPRFDESVLDSGLLFQLDATRIGSPPASGLAHRRAVEALHALGCRRVEGTSTLKDGRLSLEIATFLDRRPPGTAGVPPRGVERAWLEALPADGVMAMVSLAIDPDPASWDRAFAVADRLERIDPARAGLAPSRTRLNLLAGGVGIRLEGDVRPHLRGVTACAYGDPAQPGRVAGALIVLHLDDRAVADRLVSQASGRIGRLDPGRSLALLAVGRDVRIAWGEAAATIDRADRGGPAHSLAATCDGWAVEGRQPPARVGAFWPARLWRPAGVLDSAPAALRILADDPPVVWWGWSEPAREHDVVRWTGLRERLRRFLDALPPDPRPVTSIPPSRIPDPESSIDPSPRGPK